MPAKTSLPIKEVVLVTSGDLRESANAVCWPAQQELEQKLTACFAREGITVHRAFPVDTARGHGFISSQRMGMDVFANINPNANLVFATAAWQYTHHVLPGMRNHAGPILTVANWSGQWPGLVGLLNLNGSLVKTGTPFSTLWSETFDDPWFSNKLSEWIQTGKVKHDLSHVRDLNADLLPKDLSAKGIALAEKLLQKKAILGIFDEGCMGMYNAIVDDEILNPLGFFKERLSQSALVAKMRQTSDRDASAALDWLKHRGVKFTLGVDEKTDLTQSQLLAQCKMYIAALRMADEFGCDAIGIQYQQGLKDMIPASDLAEGLLNNRERPPVMREADGTELYAGAPLPHFNEVDECAGVDALVTNWCWKELQLDLSTTLHDLRWGGNAAVNGKEEFVWVLQISGAAPASHFIGGYAGAVSDRQPPMYFPLGGGTLKGIGRPGSIVWSRVFIESGSLHVDMGLGSVVELDADETNYRWQQTTPQWPLVNAIFHGVSRDALMSRHRANHVNVAYAGNAAEAQSALAVKAAMFHRLGVAVHLCGTVGIG